MFSKDIILENIFLITIYVLICLITIKIIDTVLDFLEKKATNSHRTAGFAAISSLRKPIKIVVSILFLYQIFTNLPKKIFFFDEIKTITFIITVIWISFRFINAYTKKVIEIKETNNETIDYGGIDFLKKISQITILIIVMLIGAGMLGISIESLMAIGGIGGMTIGFAAKDMLSNIFGGLTIYLDKPFTVGDWICSPDRQIEGIVNYIGWRQTMIMTLYQCPIYISNSIFGNIIIENKTRMRARRINELVPIRYVDIKQLNIIIKQIREMLKNSNNINHRFLTIVGFEGIKSDGILNIKVYTFTNTIDWVRYEEIKQEVLLEVANIIRANGGELAYNTREIIFKHQETTKQEILFDYIDNN